MEENKNYTTDDINETVNKQDINELDNESVEVKDQTTPTTEQLLAEEKENYIRLFAEFENYKKRTLKEKLDFFKYANQELISSLLPVLDDFERAIKQLEDEESSTTLEGVKLIYNKFYNTLTDKGLEVIKINIGDNFDVETQEAITKIDAPKESLKNKIVDVVETGYKLQDKVIRYAKVVIGK